MPPTTTDGAPATVWPEPTREVDVIIVGAGISGVAAACELQMRCPGRTYVILEGREDLGGTWDLFKYPGIRSDSDMYTFAFPFKPWCDSKTLADGPAIKAYLSETVEEYGLAKHMRFHTRVERNVWSSSQQRWTIRARDTHTGDPVTYRGRFLWNCTGYYRYSKGYTPEFKGADEFEGTTVHPQEWPEDLDYAGKRVAIIGSGATAITLVPNLAKTAKHVTMVQRSPTYVVSMPERDYVADWLRRYTSEWLAHKICRWKNMFAQMYSFQMSKWLPGLVKGAIVKMAQKQLGDSCDASIHFTPRYNPWDQRICVVPRGDLFKCVREGSASVVTGHIDCFTKNGLRLTDGSEVEADIIVTATGLHAELGGGAVTEVDGEVVDFSQQYMYKGQMMNDVPNFVQVIGYTNASWTLKVELVCAYVCRLLNYMEEKKIGVAVPRISDDDRREVPAMNLTSGYVVRAKDRLPKQGLRTPWRINHNYLLDRYMINWTTLDDGHLELQTAIAE